MWHLGFISCPADPDVWMRPALKEGGLEYYEYVLLLTDDILSVGENAERVIREEIGRCFDLKVKSIGPSRIKCARGRTR